MMNKKFIALLVAIVTVNASTFAFLDDIVGGTFNAAERVAMVPVDAIPNDQSWSEKREERRQDRENKQDARESHHERKAREGNKKHNRYHR